MGESSGHEGGGPCRGIQGGCQFHRGLLGSSLGANFIVKNQSKRISLSTVTIEMPNLSVFLVVDVNNFKNGMKPVKLQKESPAGCAGEGKQIKGN